VSGDFTARGEGQRETSVSWKAVLRHVLHTHARTRTRTHIHTQGGSQQSGGLIQGVEPGMQNLAAVGIGYSSIRRLVASPCDAHRALQFYTLNLTHYPIQNREECSFYTVSCSRQRDWCFFTPRQAVGSTVQPSPLASSSISNITASDRDARQLRACQHPCA
jgi:hypothetical protein